MDNITQGIAATVGSGVILAVLGWLWLTFIPGGKSFWEKLGTFVVGERGPLAPTTWVQKVDGIRPIFILTILALVLAAGTAIGFVFERRPGPERLLVKTFPENANSKFSDANNNDPVAAEADFDACMLSYIEVDEGASGQCGVSKTGGFWKMRVSGKHSCRVICFKQ